MACRWTRSATDNLNSAVKQVLFGRSRQENERWITFRSHYGFEAWYCQPGHEGSHEKGGVEGEGGRFRRNHCVPMPVVDSIDELNALLQAADDADDHRRISHRATSVGQDWAFEKTLLRPVPDEPFDTALTVTPRVDRYAHLLTELTPVFRHVSAVVGEWRSYRRCRVGRPGGSAGSVGVGGSGGGVAGGDGLEVGAISAA